MALITCSECAAQVSDKAATCPKCGAPVSRTAVTTTQQTGKPYKVVQAVGVGIAILGGIFMGSSDSRIVGAEMLFGGAALFLIGRALAWWKNG